MNRKLFGTLGLIIALLLAACNQAETAVGGNGGLPTLAATAPPLASATPVSAAAPTIAVTTTAAAGAEAAGGEDAATDGAETVSPDGTLDLDEVLLYAEPPGINYTTSLEFTLSVVGTDGTERVSSALMTGVRDASTPASTLDFTLSGGAAGGFGEQFTATQIGETTHYLLPTGQCVTLQAGDTGFENPFAVMLDTGGMLSGEVQRVQPNEMINGVESLHFRIERDNLASFAVSELYQADVYVAAEGGYVTRLIIDGYGSNDLLGGGSGVSGDIYYELNFTPTTDAVQIDAPAACAAAAETAYPLLPDAANQSSMAGMFSYETGQTFDDVITFYKSEMPAAGYDLVQEILQPPSGTLTFSGSGGTVMVNLAPAAGGGLMVVLLDQP